MSNQHSTFGLDPKKLAQLWSIGGEDISNTPRPDTDQYKMELLHDKLSEKMPIDQILAQALPKAFAQLCKDIKPFTGDSFGTLLNNPDTDLSIIKKIKDYNKKSAGQRDTEAARDILATLYYAAIASALIFHDQRITSFSYKHLYTKYNSYKERTWLTSEIRILFEKACVYCSKKLEQKDSRA